MLDYLHDREIRHRVEAVLVNPFDLSDELGAFGFDVGTVEIDRGYYADNRVSAFLDTSAWADYIPNSWIRLYHVASKPGETERRCRGTFAVQDAIVQAGAGEVVFSLSLMSALGAIEHDYDAWAFSIGKGAKASAVIRTICDKCGRPYQIKPDFNDYVFRTSAALPAGESFRSRLFDVCERSGNRMTVDWNGRLMFEKYVPPKEKTPSMELDVDDDMSPIIDGTISPGTNMFTRPSRAVVIYRDGDKVISAQADVGASAATSRQHRGYTIAELHELTDMDDPKTVANAQELAKSYLKDDADPTRTWDAETLWLPLTQGSIVNFAPRRYDPFGSGKPRKCLVQSIEESEDRMKLTLKEV